MHISLRNSRGFISASLIIIALPFLSASPVSADGTDANGQHCFKSMQEYLDTQNMSNFDWPLCSSATNTSQQATSTTSLSDFGDYKDPLNAFSDPDLSQFDSPSSPGFSPLKVPLLNQLDPANGPLGSEACGPTSLNMIAEFYGINIPTSVVMADAQTTQTGTSLSSLEAAAKQIGLTNITDNSGFISGVGILATGGSSAMSGLTDAVTNGSPAIVNIDLDPYSGGHAVVVTGITSDSVYINNPWNGQSQVIATDQFMSMWGAKGYGYMVPKP